jgi:hypothetical protein
MRDRACSNCADGYPHCPLHAGEPPRAVSGAHAPDALARLRAHNAALVAMVAEARRLNARLRAAGGAR